MLNIISHLVGWEAELFHFAPGGILSRYATVNSTDRSHAAHPHVQVCVAFQFFASGTFQIICGDGVQVSQLSACRYIRAVALGLQSIYTQYVSMPSPAEK